VRFFPPYSISLFIQPHARRARVVLDSPSKLGKILVGMNKALGEIPLTVKLRTGVKEGKLMAHKLMPRLSAEWGIRAAAVRFSLKTSRTKENLNFFFSCMDERDSNDTLVSRIGITSNDASMPFGQLNRNKIVSIFPFLLPFFFLILNDKYSPTTSHIWQWRPLLLLRFPHQARLHGCHRRHVRPGCPHQALDIHRGKAKQRMGCEFTREVGVVEEVRRIWIEVS